jgi:RNA polymerase sigma factor (sigma-70 family)
VASPPWSLPPDHLLRDLAPRVLGALLRKFRDFAAAEDAVQEAFIAATIQWPREGVPENPRAWLIQVASRRMTDFARSESARRLRESAVVRERGEEAPEPVHADDTLKLLFLCCHPSLTSSSAIALTLRAVAGLTTAEIARAFLVPEATMAQRISRAKAAIKESGEPFRMPTPEERAPRLRAVMHVLYLIFNEGYVASEGEHFQRLDLAHEAIRLTRAVRALVPGDSEVEGLLALMLLTDARRTARTGPAGEMIPLNQQDRSLWDRDEIAEGVALLNSALAKGLIGEYQLQASIAAVHDQAPRAEDTDWRQIATFYELLLRMTENPMVALNHAIARAMVDGPRAGLELLDALDRDGGLRGHHRLHSVRAHLLEMAGHREAAAEHFTLAAERTSTLPERNYLMTQAARLRDAIG